MGNLDFYNPTRIILEKDANKRIGALIREAGYKKVLLIFGGGSVKKNGVYDDVIKSLEYNEMEFVENWGVQVNPVLEKVYELIDVAQGENIDCVLAVGGGSVIDTAKAVCAGAYMDDVWEAFEGKTPIIKALPLFNILTLSATGTEMNKNAVITKSSEKKKWAIIDKHVHPIVSIVDPTVQYGLPWKQTVCGCIDSMAHIMEGYFTAKTEEVTMALDESLLRTLIKVTNKLQKNPKDYDARESLCWASTLALNGTSGALLPGDWSVHGIEHGISAFNEKVAHAQGLAILYPAWIETVWEGNAKHFKRWAREVYGVDDVLKAVKMYKQQLKDWNFASCLKDVGIKYEDLDAISDIVAMRLPLGYIKKFETKEDIMEVLKRAL